MIKIGRIIKAFRGQRNLKLKDLAALADISPSYLSQIENDQVNMNMSVLDNISKSLNVPVYMFFMHDSINAVSLVRSDKRDKTLRQDGVTIEQLTGAQISTMNMHIMDIPAGHNALEYSSHTGEEFLHVLEGSLSIDFSGFKKIELQTFDSVSYSSRIPHRISSKKGCRVLVNSTTPPVSL